MKVQGLIIIFFFLICAACQQRNNTVQALENITQDTIQLEPTNDQKIKDERDEDYFLITANSIGKAFIGMKLSELRKAYEEYTFDKDYLFMYGIDSESEGHLIIDNEDSLLFIWTLDDDDKIKGIFSLSEKFKTKNGIRVGMSLGELSKLYSELKIMILPMDESYEYINLKEEGLTLLFETTDENRVGLYKDHTERYEGSTKFDKSRKIDKITHLL